MDEVAYKQTAEQQRKVLLNSFDGVIGQMKHSDIRASYKNVLNAGVDKLTDDELVGQYSAMIHDRIHALSVDEVHQLIKRMIHVVGMP